LGEENKKIGIIKSSVPSSISDSDGLPNMVIAKLLRPKEWISAKPNTIDKFCFKSDVVAELARKCSAILDSQSILLSVRAPIKIFGDIHG